MEKLPITGPSSLVDYECDLKEKCLRPFYAKFALRLDDKHIGTLYGSLRELAERIDEEQEVRRINPFMVRTIKRLDIYTGLPDVDVILVGEEQLTMARLLIEAEQNQHA